MADIKTDLITVTPALAKTWLASNTVNRSTRTSQIGAFARDMQAGRWQLNGGTIIFDTTGTLLDGQHRLLAVIEANTPVQFLVVFGVAREAMPTIDSGIARTGGDVLKMQGNINCFGLASTLRLLHWYDTTDRTVSALLRRLSNAEMAELPARYPGVQATIGRVYNDTGLKGIRAVTSALCVVYYKAHAANHPLAEAFVSALSSGADMQLGDPRLTLRNWFAGKADRRRIERHHVLAVTIKAWNGFITGAPVKVLKFLDGETMPSMRAV